MKARLLCVLLHVVLLGTGAAAQGNRLWFVELECAGPLDGVHLDAGAQGGTRLEAALVAGERRTLRVPVPALSPLGRTSLPGVPLPGVAIRGAGSARVIGWSDEQPDDAWSRLDPALRARSRPPRPAAAATNSAAGLLAVAAAFVLGLALRRRLWILAPLCAGAAGVVAWIAWPRPVPAGTQGVLEARAGRWAVVVETSDALGMGAQARRDLRDLVRLEAWPEAGALDVVGDGERWGVAVPGGHLTSWCKAGRTFSTVEDLGDLGLEAVWTRDAAGRWRPGGAGGAGGAWPGGGVGPGVGTEAEPPGWLKAGLPAGRTVVVGRRGVDPGAGEPRWVRVSGLELPD